MKTEHKILVSSIFLAPLVWFGQGILKYCLHPQQSIWNEILFGLSAPEVVARLVFTAILVAFGLITFRLLVARRRAEESLTARERKLAATLENIGDAVITTDGEGKITFLNSAAQEFTDRPASEAVGRPLDEVLCLADGQSGQRIPQAVLRSPQQEISTKTPTIVLLAENGSRRPVECCVTPLRDESGNMAGMVLTLRDITEQARAVEALRREKETALKHIDIAGVMILALDERGDVTFINRSGGQILGYPESEIIGKNWFDVFIPERLREQMKTVYAKIKREEIAPVEYDENPVLNRAGEERIIARHNTYLTGAKGAIIGMLSSGEDVTEIRQAVAELQESVERYRAIFTTAEDLIFIKDQNLKFIQVNPSMERTLGLPACRLIGRTEEEAYGIEGNSHFRESDARVLAGETITEEATQPINGVPTTFHVVKTPMRDTSGAVIGLCGIARNITHRKHSENVLRGSEARLQKQNAALSRLDMRKILVRGDLLSAVHRITEIAAETLEVERAGVWLYNNDRSAIDCIDLYERSRERHSEGLSLEAKHYPNYFAALEEDRTLAAHEAHSDLRTMEFSSSYLTPHGITSMLDAPIRLAGNIAGVICCEHVGPPRRWAIDEQNFAASMADAAALTLEACDRKKAESELKESEEKYRDLIERANVGIAIVKDSRIKFVNPWLAQIMGYSVGEIVNTPFIEHVWPDNRDSARSSYTRRMAGEDIPSVFEMVIRHRDGRPIDVEVNAGIIDYQGGPADFVFVRNLAERERPAKEHSQAEMVLEYIFRESLDIIMIIDEDGGILQVSRVARDILGYAADDLVGKNVSILFPTQPPQSRDELLARLRVYGGVFTDQNILRADGSICVMDLTASVIPWEDRKVILASFRDVTDRKQVEQALGLTQFSIDRASDAAFWMGPDAGFIYVNDAACNALGYSREELLSMTVHDIDPDFPVEVWPEHWQDVKKRGSFTIESHHQAKNGRVFPVEITVNYLEFEGREYNFASARDISERRHAEEIQTALFRISEATNLTDNLEELLGKIHGVLGTLIDTTNFFVALYDAEKDHYSFPLHVDEYDHTDFTPQQLKKSLTDYVRRTGKPILINEQTHRELESKGEISLVGKPSPIWLGVPLKTAQGVIGVVVVQSYTNPDLYTETDLDLLTFVSGHIAMAIERKRAEQALRRSEELLRATLESTEDGILVVNEKGRVTHANARFAKMWRIPPEILEARDDRKLLDHVLDQLEQPQAFLAKVEELYKTTREDFDTLHFKDGGVFERYSCPLIREGLIVGRLWSFRDVTERRHAEQALRESEERLRQAQKMEAIGRLAGGVAHDFNNLLSIITGHSELLLRRLKPDSPLIHNIQEIHDAGERGGDLTRQLLAFSRKQVLEPQVLDLNQVVLGVNKMLRRLIGEDIDLVTATDTALGAVRADPGQIEQVLLNLAVNARDAMPHGGQIMIKTANVTLNDDYCREHQGVNPGPYILLAVHDTGHGIDPKTQAHIFEPFFTTKGPGKGTGLGLSTVYGIVKQSGGHIQVHSEPEQGTTFEVYLPHIDSTTGTRKAGTADTSGQGKNVPRKTVTRGRTTR